MRIGRTSGMRRTAGGLAFVLAAAPLVITTHATAAQVAPGTPYTWGSNSFGQLGNGTISTSPAAPAPVAGLDGVVDLHGGREHVAALTSTGDVYTWGSNGEGQLGLGDSADRSLPTHVSVPCGPDEAGVARVTAVATGHNSTLALCGNGTVWAWGLNTEGQLGDGTRTTRRAPVRVAGLTGAVAIAAGRDMSYAIKSDGTAWGWGDNQYGELGDGSTTDRVSLVRIGALSNVVGIAGGRDHGLALRSDGSVYAFGWNAYGQLGDGTLTDRSSPVLVSGLSSGVTEVVAGAHHSYALRAGQVLSWGRNYRAELGDGTTTARSSPVAVLGSSGPVTGVVSVGAGRDHGVAVLADGSVRTWGYNAGGQLGDGTTINRSRAVTVAGVSGATEAAGGGEEYSVVLAGPAANQAPTARITVSCTQLVCAFDGTTSSDADGTVTGYSWGFGDGSGPATGARITHTYAGAGSYPVTLSVTDEAGASGQATTQVVVAATPPAVVRDGVTTFVGTTSRPAVAVPGQAATGDRLLLFLSTARNATATLPAGWTLLQTVADGTDLRSWVFSRQAVTGSAGSVVQVGLDASSKCTAVLYAYAGAGPPTAAGLAEPGTTAAHRAPAATVPTAGSTIVGYWVDKSSTVHGWALPPALTARAATSGSGTGFLTSVSGDASGVATGTWPSTTATADVRSAKAVAWTVVLPPA
ncbi:MAG TPA: PKD domain-containing protein [Nocardioidaceae bacterium]|nr:PKD domain-containing protein [Nocardioidaceae bacterium]